MHDRARVGDAGVRRNARMRFQHREKGAGRAAGDMHPRNGGERGGGRGAAIEHRLVRLAIFPQEAGAPVELVVEPTPAPNGRASWRERVCLYVWVSSVAVSVKKKETSATRSIQTSIYQAILIT